MDPNEIDTEHEDTELEDTQDLDLTGGDDLSSDDTPPTDKTKPKSTPPPAKDDELRAAVRELTTTVTKLHTPKNEPKQLSQEELETKLQVFKPSDDFFKEFFGLDENTPPARLEQIKKTWAQFQNGIVRQAVVGALHLAEESYGKLTQRLDAAEEFVSAARAKELRSSFHEAYPALADKKYNKILNLVARGLGGQDFKSENEYFKALAEGAAEVIREQIPDFALDKPKTPSQQTPRIPRTRAGGTGGAGATPSGGSGDTSDDIWDE